MGVMQCSRRGCDEIMCRTYINNIGYICRSCQNEFNEKLSNQADERNIKLTESVITNELTTFMQTDKGIDDKEEMTVDEYFNKNS